MGAVVVDSSVVIGFIQADDVHHRDAVAEVRAARLRGDSFVLPATVLIESTVSAQRAGSAIGHRLQRDLIAFFGPVRPVDEAVAVATTVLRTRFRSLRIADALVVATGIVDDAVVLTCDSRWAGVDPRVQVIGG